MGVKKRVFCYEYGPPNIKGCLAMKEPFLGSRVVATFSFLFFSLGTSYKHLQIANGAGRSLRACRSMQSLHRRHSSPAAGPHSLSQPSLRSTGLNSESELGFRSHLLPNSWASFTTRSSWSRRDHMSPHKSLKPVPCDGCHQAPNMFLK